MRLTVALTLLAAVAVAMVRAADSPSATPSDDAIISACGARLIKVFAQFGTPADVYPYHASTRELDGVTFSYGAYGFTIRDKTVRECWFWSDWKGSVKGVKMGDGRQDVEKVLGTNHRTDKQNSKSALGDFGFDLKDLDAVLWADFDKDNKLCQIEVVLN